MHTSRQLLLSCLLAVALAQAGHALQPRQSDILSLSIPGDETTSGPATTAGPVTTQESQSSTTTTTTTQQQQPASATTTSDTTTKQVTSQDPNPSTQQQPTATVTSDGPKAESTTKVEEVVTTNSAGDNITVTLTRSNSNTATDSSPTSSSTSAASESDDDDSDESGLGTGSIIGLSVAGGVAVLGVIAFVIWKLTRKRFNEFDDTEAIKWPELNAHGDSGDAHALPVHNTGRAGFDTGSEVSLSRAPSQTGTNYSTPDLGSHDPYAVPPLPHLNPGQPIPYHDDPNAAGAYYDPYRGPVPNTFNDPAAPGAEAYPMTQMGRPEFEHGRASPSLAGRASPGPQAAYGMGPGRIASPGPQMAYGRSSPGPQMAYGRSASPGPQAAYGPR